LKLLSLSVVCIVACGGGPARETGTGTGTGAGTQGTGGEGGCGGSEQGLQVQTGPICTALASGARLGEDFAQVDPPLRFDRGGALHPEAAAAIAGLAEVLGRCPGARIEIRVTTPERAASVTAALAGQGVQADRVTVRAGVSAAFLEGLPQGEAARQETEIVRTDPVGCAEGV